MGPSAKVGRGAAATDAADAGATLAGAGSLSDATGALRAAALLIFAAVVLEPSFSLAMPPAGLANELARQCPSISAENAQELKTLGTLKCQTLYGNVHKKDLEGLGEEWPWGVAGDEDFDPLADGEEIPTEVPLVPGENEEDYANLDGDDVTSAQNLF